MELMCGHNAIHKMVRVVMVPIFNGYIQADQSGHLLKYPERQVSDFISSMSGPVEIIIRPVKQKRSLPSNRYYWGVVLRLISEHTGHTQEEVHTEMKDMFLRWYYLIESTTKADGSQFFGYLEFIKWWAASWLGVYIPDPNQVDY